MKLIDAPVGLFWWKNVLVLKTEYSTDRADGLPTPDCYIVSSGEFFWGPPPQTAESMRNCEVDPVPMSVIDMLEMDRDDKLESKGDPA